MKKYRYLVMHFLKSHRGFSLIEVLIGMVILSILVGGVLSVTIGPDLRLFADKVVGNSSCRAEAHRIMSNFKNKGLTRSHYYFDASTDYSAGAPTTVPFPIATSPLPAPGTNVRPVIAELAANEEGVDFVQRWADPVYTINDPTTGPSLIRPYKLTMGVITAIETIYNNNNATVCASATGLAASSAVAPLTTLLSPPNNTAGLVNPEAYLRIRAYSANGTPIACGTNITTRPPRGTAITTNQVPAGLNLPNSVANYPAAPPAALGVGAQVLPPAVRDDISWEVNIIVTHTNRSGQVENCSVAERFQYPSVSPTRALDVFDNTGLTFDGIGPANTATLPLTFNTPLNGPNLACNSAVVPAMRVRLNHARPGSIFMCRNLSAQRPTT
ncbi:prepilin-type N-terminal cleavage/methylation domain-containing protein, partial [bacterium]|nr:prepilin-type N-terminal cleavage/methylation domain-containing protein [bacterium]